MRAVAHGFQPDRVKAPPAKVAKEFEKADEAKAEGDSTAIKSRLKSLNKGFPKAAESKEGLAKNVNEWMGGNAKLNALRARKKY